MSAGHKLDIPKRLIELDVAQSLCVGLTQARRLIRDYSAAGCIGAKRVRDLRKWGSSKNGPQYLAVHKESYLKMRANWGFKS
jgi:hypothetical protein